MSSKFPSFLSHLVICVLRNLNQVLIIVLPNNNAFVLIQKHHNVFVFPTKLFIKQSESQFWGEMAK